MYKFGFILHPGSAGDAANALPAGIARAIVSRVVPSSINRSGSRGPRPYRLGLKSNPKLKPWLRIIGAYAGLVGVGIVNERVDRQVPFDKGKKAVAGSLFQAEGFLE